MCTGVLHMPNEWRWFYCVRSEVGRMNWTFVFKWKAAENQSCGHLSPVQRAHSEHQELFFLYDSTVSLCINQRLAKLLQTVGEQLNKCMNQLIFLLAFNGLHTNLANLFANRLFFTHPAVKEKHCHAFVCLPFSTSNSFHTVFTFI